MAKKTLAERCVEIAKELCKEQQERRGGKSPKHVNSIPCCPCVFVPGTFCSHRYCDSETKQLEAEWDREYEALYGDS